MKLAVLAIVLGLSANVLAATPTPITVSMVSLAPVAIGQRVTFTVSNDVTVATDKQIVIPSGAVVLGVVTKAVAGKLTVRVLSVTNKDNGPHEMRGGVLPRAASSHELSR